MLDAIGGPLMAVIAAFFLFAVLGLAGSLAHQWRAWRRRRFISRSR